MTAYWSISDTIRWARSSGEVEVVDALPRYHPWWARWVIRVPGVRAIVAWNFLIVLRRTGPIPGGAAEKQS